MSLISGGRSSGAVSLLPTGKYITDASSLGKSFAAIGDGSSHPASAYYSSLVALQADYSTATSLSEEMDTIVIRQMINDEEYFILPAGKTFLIDSEVSASGKTFYMQWAPSASVRFTPSSHLDIGFDFANCNVNLLGYVDIDGNDLVTAVMRQTSNGTFRCPTFAHVHGYGSDTFDPNNWTVAFWFDGTDEINAGYLKFSDAKNNSTASYGNALGKTAVRGVLFVNAGWANIETYNFDATGCEGKEVDLFHANVGCEGGYVGHIVLYHNHNTRRDIKIQSGKWTIGKVFCDEASDFTPVSGSTDAGLHCLNCIDVTANSNGATLNILSGYVNAAAFAAGIGDSAGGEIYIDVENVELVGSAQNVVRTFPESGSSENKPSIGFYTHSDGTGRAGIRNSTVKNFIQGAKFGSDNSFAFDMTFEDQVNQFFQMGPDGTAVKTNQQYKNIKCVTKTSGRLSSSRMILAFNVQDLRMDDIEFIEDGNTTYSSQDFIFFSRNTATGRLKNIDISKATNTLFVDLGSTTEVYLEYNNHGEAALTDGATISWNTSHFENASVTLGGNRTVAKPTGLVKGGAYSLRIVQDATGSRTLTWNSAFKWPGGTAPTLSTAAGAIDIISFISDGTDLYGVAQTDFS